MEVIAIDGQQFVKASVAARQAGYTADYVGQLARSGAVPARLIGRTWYVDVETLRTHRVLKKRSARLKAREQVKKALAERKALAAVPSEPQKVSRYEEDQSDLMPEVVRRDDRVAVRVVPTTVSAVAAPKAAEENEGLAQVTLKKELERISAVSMPRRPRQVIAPRRVRATETKGHNKQLRALQPKALPAKIVGEKQKTDKGRRPVSKFSYVVLVVAVIISLFLIVFEIKDVYSIDQGVLFQSTEYVINIGTLLSIISL